jgi:hypothetical protein
LIRGLFLPVRELRNVMRIVPAAAVPTSPAPVPATRDHISATAIVCTALMLALVFLALRIAGGLVAWM